LSDLTDILKRVKAGEASFEATSYDEDALRQFQTIGKALAHANKEGLLERCEFSKDSLGGDRYYNAAYVIGGLSFKGEEYLRRETTVKGWLAKHSPSFFQWAAGIVAGVILAALVAWLL
jgi:hypothetical protein